jgi:hypothetical protein
VRVLDAARRLLWWLDDLLTGESPLALAAEVD